MRRSLKHPSRSSLCALSDRASRTSCYRALGQRSAAGVRRRRVRARLRDAAGQLAAGNQPRACATSRRSCARRRKWRARRGAPGLELGLAAVTEPNTGDIAVKLKADRSRGVDEVISDVRAKVGAVGAGARRRVHPGAAGHDRRPHRRAGAGRREAVLAGRRSASTWAPQVAEALGEGEDRRRDAHRRRRGRHREHDERSGGALHRQSRSRRSRRIHAEELGTVGVAMVEGEPALAPVLVNDRPYPAARAVPAVGARVARSDEQHDARQLDRIDRDARIADDDRRAAGTDRSAPREPAAARRSDGAARRRRHGHGHRRRAEGRRRPEAAAVDPRRVRRHVQGAAEIVPRSRRPCSCWRSC